MSSLRNSTSCRDAMISSSIAELPRDERLLSIGVARCESRRVLGHTSSCLYAVWSNPAPGVSAERFREYYEDVHRPDTLAIGHFERSFRYEAQGACRARFLTLWEAEYPDLDRALEP